MSESVIRFERSKGYTTLQNSMLRDPRLSLKAKGLFAIMASLPYDWDYRISGLATVCNVGKDAIRGALREMEEAGYLIREQSHTEGGQFGGCVYVIHEESGKPMEETPSPDRVAPSPLSENPTTVKPTTDKPSSGNPTLLNKEIQKKEIDSPPKVPQRGRRKEELSPEARKLLNDYVAGDKELAEAMVVFMEVREASKKATNSDRAIKLLLAELDKLSGGDRDAKLQLVKQSGLAGWVGLFPLKGGGYGGQAYPPGKGAQDEYSGAV